MSTQRWSDDASFYGTLLELWALEEYISILEVQLPSLTEKEKHRLRQDLRADDEQGLHYTEIAEIELDEGITTRLITGSALIATWATFESAVRRAAGILGQPREAILDTSQKLFKRLGIPHPNQIKDFYSLRNALAHANGRVEDIALDRANEKRLKEVNEI
ncbi:MAG TPA: hypothetical protein VGO73_10230, partial [Pyrinomonadaceae bacterium]|nr:hypothetical protein [Pyrinomonadaceae bacterium]